MLQIFAMYNTPAETILHILGQITDSFLFVYLVNHFFIPAGEPPFLIFRRLPSRPPPL